MGIDGIRAATDKINRLSYEREVARLLREPMTLDTFARLRSAREWLTRTLDRDRWVHSTLELGGTMGALAWPVEPITARAGEWIHDTGRDGHPRSMKSYRWHIFTGDISWRPSHTNVSAGTLCGIGVHGGHVVSGETPGEGGACLYCSRLRPNAR